MLNEKQQILEQINRAKEILITCKEHYSGDSLASVLAWQYILKKMGKSTTTVISNFTVPNTYKFLPQINEIKSDLLHLKKFTIVVKTTQTPIEELSYDKTDQAILISLTPKFGIYSEKDVSFQSSDYKYDLIFVLDSPDLESIGQIYEKQTDFFYHTPIINIDHSPANEYFGQINVVDLTATATSEITFSILNSLGIELLDETLATYIYTGMTEKTKSFKTNNITPNTLNIASQLIQAGADREKIITHLYRTKSIQILKLWGRALAKLQLDPKLKLAWTSLNKLDFAKTGTKEEHLQGLVEEIITETPQAEIILIFSYHDDQTINLQIHTNHKYNAMGLLKAYSPEGNKIWAKAKIKSDNLENLVTTIITEIKQHLEKTTI